MGRIVNNMYPHPNFSTVPTSVPRNGSSHSIVLMHHLHPQPRCGVWGWGIQDSVGGAYKVTQDTKLCMGWKEDAEAGM